MYIDSGMRIAAVYCCVVVKPRAPRLSRRDETEYNERIKREQQKSKFDFEELKAGAMSPDPRTRKDVFKEYFERFEEFPSYLFDNSEKIDSRLFDTIEDLKNDPETTTVMHKGIATLMQRLPSS